MFSSIINNISKPFHRSQSNQQTTECPSGISRNDRLEDGFLLVGDTASERTTIQARNFRADIIDAPPAYGQLSNCDLPSYQNYTSGTYAQSPTLDVTQFPGLKHGSPFQTGSTTVNSWSQNSERQNVNPSQGFTARISNKTAISDVPFELGHGLQTSTVISDSQRESIFQQKTFDFAHYDYDFSLELSLLREHDVLRDNEGMEIAY